MNTLSYVRLPACNLAARGTSVCLLGLAILWAQTGMAQVPRSIRDQPEQTNTDVGSTNVTPLFAFTHEAYIAGETNVAGIRLIRIKEVEIPTTEEAKEDQRYCQERYMFAEPGGSEFCPEVKFTGFEPAYQVTYSYTASSLPGDEHGGGNFTFSVFFRPEEVDAQTRALIAERRVHDAAEYFGLTTTRATATRPAIDMSASKLCPGSFIEGIWTETHSTCQEKVARRTVMESSQFLVVRVAVHHMSHESTLVSHQLTADRSRESEQ